MITSRNNLCTHSSALPGTRPVDKLGFQPNLGRSTGALLSVIEKGRPVEPIRQLPDLIQAFEDTISVEQQERRRINSLVNIVERYCAGVSDEFLNQFETGSQKYTRHLLHADAEDRFSLLALVWKPGQGTPIHDHPSWGVLGVLRGRMRFTNYAPDEVDGQRCLIPVETFIGTAGSVGTVYPPAMDLHRMDNCSEDEVAVTLHAYGLLVKEFHIYSPETAEKREATSTFDTILEGAMP
ncbi:MAG TPA: hypothetical protein DGU45_05575 [Planctomycetes bacterium]|nr:hypothetical protein [Planctomycetota bacterium]